MCRPYLWLLVWFAQFCSNSTLNANQRMSGLPEKIVEQTSWRAKPMLKAYQIVNSLSWSIFLNRIHKMALQTLLNECYKKRLCNMFYYNVLGYCCVRKINGFLKDTNIDERVWLEGNKVNVLKTFVIFGDES